MAVTISKLDTDIIVETINTGSSWIPKYNGIRLTHIPSKVIVKCCDYDSKHKNYVEAFKTLNSLIKDNKLCRNIPIEELEKLEQARVNLYEFLGENTDMDTNTRTLSEVLSLTEQIWKVANIRIWEKE